MKLDNILIATEVVRPGMIVEDVFRECVTHSVHALPYCPTGLRPQGRVTLKNIMKFACIPEYMIELADMLSNNMSCLDNAAGRAREILAHPIESYVLPFETGIGLEAPVIKAVAKMEKHDTSYLFVLDEQGDYRGIITISGVAKRMLELNDQPIRAT